jgi:two-component system phosphate regulon sensor histidine kinase PhoR
LKALRLRARVALASLAVGLAAVLAVDAYLSTSLRSELMERTADWLERTARLIVDRLTEHPPPGTSEALDALADRLGAAAAARVTLIAADGRVLGDSDVDHGRLAAVENHRDRPEVAVALQGGTGRAERRSSTVQQPMMYVAAGVPRGGPVHVARVAVSLRHLDELVTRTRWLLVGASAIALGVAVVVSLLIARIVTRSLTRLTEVARAMAAGDYRQRAEVGGRDEVGALASAMNRLAEELAATVGRLGEERDLLTAVLDGLEEGVLVVGPDARVLRVNPALSRTLGIGPETRGQSALEATRQPALAEALSQCLQSRQNVSREITTAAPARTLISLIAPLPSLGGGAVAVFHDITTLRRLERVRSDFVSNVSHELRTPVAALRAAAETLLASAVDDPERARAFLGVIERHAERLTRLISDLLDLSRIESGEMRLEREPVELARAALAALEVVEDAATSKRLEMMARVEGLRVLGDEHAVEQVLVNLLDNAVKYTPEGGRVEISATAQEDRVSVSVADTGPGLAPEHLRRIFERFYRVDRGRSREVGGTGLGLAIVKHLVEAMGGEVRAESAPGKGSTFTFTLPQA